MGNELVANGPRALLDNTLAFLAITLELVLGAAVFYVIIHFAHYLEQDIASMNETAGSVLYYVENGGEIFFLGADCLIGLFFVTRGIRNAWNATWGS
jgi:hypothetical protein